MKYQLNKFLFILISKCKVKHDLNQKYFENKVTG